MAVGIDDLFGPLAPTFLCEGDVVDVHARPLKLRAIIHRAWGWPKKASYEAADVIVKAARDRGPRGVGVWLDDKNRLNQQRFVLAQRPGILDMLLSGLHHDWGRERYDIGHELKQVVVSFSRPVVDVGLTRAFLRSLANRFGMTIDEVRSVTHFDTATNVVALDVDVDAADEELRRAG